MSCRLSLWLQRARGAVETLKQTAFTVLGEIATVTGDLYFLKKSVKLTK